MNCYTDEGISALSTAKRDGFNQMVSDALEGKIQLIVTKSVSRFARNTVDSLTTIRSLKAHGVEVYFEKENIWTIDAKGELLITLMSSLAQEESRSISENVTWGRRKRMADGQVCMPYGQFLGYRKGPDGKPEIVPEEAELVRRIYKEFMSGMAASRIAKTLTKEGVPTPGGREKWQISVIESILSNLTLKLGYRTVLQDSSVVYTDAPVKWNAFIKQQMRWASGSQYNNLKMTPWMCRHAPLMAFIYWPDMLMPILLVSVYLNMTVCYVLKRLGLPVGSIEYTGSIWMILVFVFLGCMLGFGVRHIRVFLKLPWYYILMIPLLVLVLSFLMVYIRIFGLMRCADGTAWGTRVLSAEAPRQKSFRRKAMPAFAFILLCSCAIGGFRLLDYAPRLFRPVTVFDDTGKNVGIYQTEPADIELMREKPDILGWFEAWGTSPAKEKAQICIREHMTPLINWSPYDYTLTDIGNGKHDELIRNYLTEINQTYGDRTVLIRLAHEMENYDTGNWYPWQYKGGEKDYIHMWRHVVAIGREVAPHVRWIWSPNRMTPQSIRWYPGDEYVDYISITLNHKANRVPSYPIFEDYFRQEGVEKHFNRINKKIILSEVGYANQDETRRGEYLQSIFDWVEQDDRICGVVFFNHNKMEESQYRFSDSRYLMDIWYNGLQHMHQYSKNSAVTALQEAKKGE